MSNYKFEIHTLNESLAIIEQIQDDLNKKESTSQNQDNQKNTNTNLASYLNKKGDLLSEVILSSEQKPNANVYSQNITDYTNTAKELLESKKDSFTEQEYNDITTKIETLSFYFSTPQKTSSMYDDLTKNQLYNDNRIGIDIKEPVNNDLYSKINALKNTAEDNIDIPIAAIDNEFSKEQILGIKPVNITQSTEVDRTQTEIPTANHKSNFSKDKVIDHNNPASNIYTKESVMDTPSHLVFTENMKIENLHGISHVMNK